MLINVSEGEECRIALVEDGKLEELYMERTSSTSHVRNIYKGRVTNVEPSIQAAFVDFGLGRNGFLHISDLMPTYFGRRGEGVEERVGQKMARRDRPPIQRCLRRGDEIVVQIIKEGIGTKGPTLSTYLSIPGRMLVMMPGMESKGVSRKIEDDAERRRLKQILDSLQPPKGVGFILRTESVGKTKAEIERDFKYLTRLWENIDKRQNSGPGPMELYTEGDLVTRTVRDLFTSDIDRIIVDNELVAATIKDVIKLSNPRTRNRIEVYTEPVPMFHKFGIEREIELMYSRHVPLPSGGGLVIDSTEAIVAIDVNSGKFREHADAETTAFKTDMEAADEIPRQLRLRDLGGVIICDFIDLRYERHRRELEQRLHDNFKKDRAKTKVLRMSQFGIIEMTRQRMRPSLKRSIYFDCPHCKGAGLVKTPESMGLDVMRRLAIALNDLKVVRVELAVCPDVAFYLNNKKRVRLAALEADSKKRVVVRSDPALGLDEMRLDLFDIRDGVVILPELGDVLATQPHTSQLGVRPAGRPQSQRTGGRPDDRKRQGGRPGQPAGKRGGGAQQGRNAGRGRRDDEEQAMLEDRYEAEQMDEGAELREDAEIHEGAELDEVAEAERSQAHEPDTEDRAAEEIVGDDESGREERPRDDRGRGDRGRGGRDDNRGRQGAPGGPSRQDGRGFQGGRGPRGGDRGPQVREAPGGRAPQGDRSARERFSNRGDNGAARPPRGPARNEAIPATERRDDLPEDRRPAGGEGGGPPGGEQEGGPRRRRRRGRRGRGRGRQGQGPEAVGQGQRVAPSDGPEPFDRDDSGPVEEVPFEADREEGAETFDRGPGRADFHDEHAEEYESTITSNEPVRQAQDRSESAQDERDLNPEDRADLDRAPFEGYDQDSEGSSESIVEEPVIEADEQGRILSETVESHAYVPAPSREAETAAPERAEPPQAPPAAKPKGRGKGSRAPRARGGRAKAGAAKSDQTAASPEAEADVVADEKPAKPRRRGSPSGKKRGGRAAADAKPTDEASPIAETQPAAPSTAEPIRPAVVKISTDRHLIEDEPIAPEPPPRPRSFRDLDSIPDDYD